MCEKLLFPLENLDSGENELLVLLWYFKDVHWFFLEFDNKEIICVFYFYFFPQPWLSWTAMKSEFHPEEDLLRGTSFRYTLSSVSQTLSPLLFLLFSYVKSGCFDSDPK